MSRFLNRYWKQLALTDRRLTYPIICWICFQGRLLLLCYLFQFSQHPLLLYHSHFTTKNMLHNILSMTEKISNMQEMSSVWEYTYEFNYYPVKGWQLSTPLSATLTLCDIFNVYIIVMKIGVVTRAEVPPTSRCACMARVPPVPTEHELWCRGR